MASTATHAAEYGTECRCGGHIKKKGKGNLCPATVLGYRAHGKMGPGTREEMTPRQRSDSDGGIRTITSLPDYHFFARLSLL